MKKKATLNSVIASLTQDLTSPVAQYADFLTLIQRLSEVYGNVRRTSSASDTNAKGQVCDIEEVRTWKISNPRYLTLIYSTDHGLSITVGDEDGDSDDSAPLFLVPARLPKNKPTRKKKPEKGLLTPEQFEIILSDIEYEDVDIKSQSDVLSAVLEAMLGESVGESGDSGGNGKREWEVGNAALTLSWSTKGTKLKLIDKTK